MTVKLHCPNFWGFERFYADILNAPQQFKREDTKIVAVYGCFPGQIWNGGRPQNPNQLSDVKRIEQEFEIYFNKLDVPIELTFNNMLIDETDIKDEYCNEIAKIAEKYETQCTVASRVLQEHLRKNYPNLRLKRSCIMCEDGKDWELEGWDTCVLDQFKGGDLDLLASIPKEFRERIEIVANVECKDGCKLFYRHHRCMAECQKYGSSQIIYNCPLGPNYMPMHFARLQKHYVSPEKAQEYAQNGYEHYKLVSRCNLGQAIHEICLYYFKTEYVPDCVARGYMMFGVPMKIGLPIDFNMYFTPETDPLGGINDVG